MTLKRNGISDDSPALVLHGFLNQLLVVEKQAVEDVSSVPVVEDNARSHGTEEFHDSFSRRPPTPSNSFLKRQLLARWDDSFELSERSPGSTTTTSPLDSQHNKHYYQHHHLQQQQHQKTASPASLFSPNSVMTLEKLVAISSSNRRKATTTKVEHEEEGLSRKGQNKNNNKHGHSTSTSTTSTADILKALPLDNI